MAGSSSRCARSSRQRLISRKLPELDHNAVRIVAVRGLAAGEGPAVHVLGRRREPDAGGAKLLVGPLKIRHDEGDVRRAGIAAPEVSRERLAGGAVVLEQLEESAASRSEFDPAALCPVLLVAASDPAFGRWLPLRADPATDCVAPIVVE